jgi:hypothetical protein
MAEGKIFVSRKAELEQFEQVLAECVDHTSEKMR